MAELNRAICILAICMVMSQHRSSGPTIIRVADSLIQGA
jgi:hypothetical protein